MVKKKKLTITHERVASHGFGLSSPISLVDNVGICGGYYLFFFFFSFLFCF
jgi:hypothetical protein